MEDLAGHRKIKFGMRRVKSKNENTGVGKELTPLTMKPFTFSYEVADPKSLGEKNQHAYVTSPKPSSAFEFGSAFEFSPYSSFDDQKTPKVKKKDEKSVPDDIFAALNEEIPIHYQSIFTYESIFHDGCTLTLPFVDECHIVDITEQSLTVKPLTATTSDTGEVEVGCQVVFHIVEPEAAVTYWSRDPHNLISKRAETALVSAVARIQWDDIISGHGSADIASDVRASLNAYCSPIGIQILEVKLTSARSIKDPPKISDQVRNIDFRKVGRQIASLSPLFMGGVSDGPVSATQQASVQFTSLINQIALMKSQSASTTAPLDPLATPDSEVAVTAEVNKVEVDQLVERALARSQIFLGNEKARAALGSSSLQVFVYSSDIHQENERMAAFYMDADTGKGEVGTMQTKTPSCTVHMRAAHLAETLEGRFDLLEAMKVSQIHFSGSLLALSKLRYLLQFK
nr:stomatin [Hymenolepis microstoma]